jgi:hypothetical protein
MKMRTIWIKYERTAILGGGNEMTAGCTLQADVDDDENFVDVIATLQEIARLAVKNEFARLPKKPAPSSGQPPAPVA